MRLEMEIATYKQFLTSPLKLCLACDFPLFEVDLSGMAKTHASAISKGKAPSSFEIEPPAVIILKSFDILSLRVTWYNLPSSNWEFLAHSRRLGIGPRLRIISKRPLFWPLRTLKGAGGVFLKSG